MRRGAILFLLAVFLVIPCADAAEVTLSTPQRDYYALPGETALIPVTITSTYDHDIPGTLKMIMVPEGNGTAGSVSPGAIVTSRDFSAFTEPRTISFPAGTAGSPGDFRITFVFAYPEYGGRIATLSDIRIHFTTTPGTSPSRKTIMGTDMPDPAAARSSGITSHDHADTAFPAAALVGIILVSTGIWYLAGACRKDRPAPAGPENLPEPDRSFRELAACLLDEAERDAAAGSWPEACRKTGQAIRMFVSNEMGDGNELSDREAEHLLQSSREDTADICGILEQCRIVGFAGGRIRPGEFRKMLHSARTLLGQGRTSRKRE